MQTDEQESSPEVAFGRAVRKRRGDLALSQRDLGEEMTRAGFSAVDGPAISRIEKGNRQVRLNEAIALANILETSVENLVYEEDPPRILEALRRDSNEQMRYLVVASSAYVRSLVYVRNWLVEHPDLVSHMRDEAVGNLAQPEEYFGWVLKRLQRLASEGLDGPARSVTTEIGTPEDLEILRRILSVNSHRALFSGDPGDEVENGSAET